VWLKADRALVIADLHLGYAWAHRYNGQLLPVAAKDDIVQRLQSLCKTYSPKHLILLGDIVHQALPLEPIKRDLDELRQCFGQELELVLIRGNHDRKLKPLATEAGLTLTLEYRLGTYLFIHGDQTATSEEPKETTTFMGHEHPAISLGDGISNRKFPCFLVSKRVIILPAFSNWAAGTNVRNGHFMSALAKETRFNQAVAIMGDKLLKVPL
jgi:putative SbcD/Mre11-related phosphoesterase